MIEHVVIFTKGGLVLWSYTLNKLKANVINELISKVLLEERSGKESFMFQGYTVKWSFANEFDLVLAAVYQTTLSDVVKYADDLLDIVKSKFCGQFSTAIMKKNTAPVDTDTFDSFSDQFKTILTSVEEKSNQASQNKGPRSFWDTKKGQELAKQKKESGKPVPAASGGKKKTRLRSTFVNQGNEEDDADDEGEDDQGNEDEETAEAGADGASENAAEADSAGASSPNGAGSAGLSPDEIQRRLQAKFSKGKKTSSSPTSPKSPTEPKKRTKAAATSWDPNKKLSKAELEALDFSDKSQPTTIATPEFDPTKRAPIRLDDDSDDDSDEDDEQEGAANKKPATGGIMGLFRNFSILGKELTREDVDPVLAEIKNHLITKNVAQEIATKLCDSVGTSLVGKQLGSFTRVSSAVKEAMQQALTKILTPKRNVDVLREIKQAQEEKRPYSIVFVGVNGVGKSTSLAKVCSWLQQQQLKVQITACDTFRSGAVEQLGVHARALGVPLFQQGYGKDSSAIAKQSITKAKSDGIDVVLIDTAGRMQDNEPLMKALAKLIQVNSPDLILFVGEALVGNDSVDQLTKFNRALEEFGDPTNPRLIDGIVLTKFDTVDDKVGAAISMVYTTGQPIVFIGVGQSYSDIRTLNIKRIVNILLKGRT